MSKNVVLLIVLCTCGFAAQVTVSNTGDAQAGATVTTTTATVSPAASTDVSLTPVPGWPKQVGVGSLYKPTAVTLADINGDDTLEIVAGSTDRKVYAWDWHGNDMPGWPKTIAGEVQSKVAVGDPFGDGRAALFVAARDGNVYAFWGDGSPLAGWPQPSGGTGGMVSPTLCDIDHDDTLEVIAPSYPPGRVNVWNIDGTAYPGWPQSLDYLACATASAADVDGDGTVEICAPSYRSLYLWDKDGVAEPGWPKQLGDGASYAQPCLYDLDNDGKLEIGYTAYPSGNPRVHVFRYDGTNQPGWPNTVGSPQPYVCPVAGVLDVDTNRLSIFSGGHMFNAPGFYGWFADGGAMPGWPVNPDFLECSPVVYGVGGADDMGVMIASNTTPGALYAYDIEGELIEGFPVATPDAALPNSPAIADVDLDLNMEVALMTKDGSVSLWTTEESHHPHTTVDWACWFHDNWHTGWLHPLPPTGLRAERGNPGARLYWHPSREPDIRGYRVYRGGGPSGWFDRLFDRPISDTTYLDTTAVGDTARIYRVTAIIRAGNESRQSAGVTINPTGVENGRQITAYNPQLLPTLVRNVLFLHQSLAPGPQPLLIDVSGRLVMSLRPGRNDLRGLAPGVYHVAGGDGTVAPARIVYIQ